MANPSLKRRLFFSLISFSLLTSACSFEKLAADNMAPVLVKTSAKFNRSGIPQAAREAAPGLLVTLDGILSASPENETLLLLKSELNASFAFGFLEEEYRFHKREYEEKKAALALAWANELYLNARESARQVIDQHDDEMLAIIDKKNPEEILAALKEEFDEDEVPAVFWLAFSWGAYINLNIEKGADVTKDVPRVKALMQFVLDTKEDFYNGGAHLFFAMLNLSLGKSIGGRPDIALKHLEAVDRITKNRFLMNKIIYAQYYLPQVQTPSGKVSAEERNKQAKKVWNDYLKTLEEVMKAKDDLWPEQRLQNAVAKRRAESLYYRAEDILFPPPGVKIPKRPDEDDEDEDE